MRSKGFTLIEILVALAIFVILASITSAVLYNSFTTRKHLLRQSESLENIELVILLLKKDLLQAVNKPIMLNDYEKISAFIATDVYFEFTRGGYTNPNHLAISNLKHVAWYCQNQQLVRRSWQKLTGLDRKNYQENIYLKNLKKCQFKYLNNNLQTLSAWRGEVLDQSQKKEPLPTAVQITLTFTDWGNLVFLFALPQNNSYENKFENSPG